MKKFISIILCLAMVFSMASFTAFAENAQTVADAISVDTITTETANLITKNLTLPTEIDGQSVTWASSDASVITNDGKVTRHATEEKAVTLTATVGGVTKEIALTVAPLTTTVIYQNNFARKLDGTEFDTSKELVGANADTTQIDNWKMSTAQTTAPFGTTVGATGGINIDLQARGNSPTFTFPEELDSPFYIRFDVSTQTVSPGIEFRMTYRPEGGKATVLQTMKWNAGNTYLKGKNLSNYGGKNFASTENKKTAMCLYIDPISSTLKVMDAEGKFVPEAGLPISGATDKNGVVTAVNFCRAGSSNPAGFIEIDNFAVYRTATETQVFNDRVMLRALAENITFADFSDEDAGAVTENLDLSVLKNEIESANDGVTVSFVSSNEDILKIDGTTGVITRPADNTQVKMEVVVSKGASTFGKTIAFTVKEADNPAKQAGSKIIFEMLSNQAMNAVTENLDLSLTEFYSIEDAEVSFSSSNPDVLLIDGDTAYVNRGDEKTEVTLTAAVSKDGRTYDKNFNLTVLPTDAYLYVSDNFNYRELSGKSAGVLDRWTVQDNYGGKTYTKLFYDETGGYVETARIETAGGYDENYYDFTRMRKVDTLRVEMDFDLAELPSGSMLDVYFIGVKEGGIVHNDIENGLFKFRISPGGISVTAKSSVSAVVNEGDKFNVALDFDFTTDTVQIYIDGKKLGGVLGFKGSAYDFESIYKLNIRSYRASAPFRVKMDNLAIYSENADFSSGVIDGEFDANRPMQVSITEYVSGGLTYGNMAITTKYDENTTLTQNLIQKPESLDTNPIVDFRGASLNDINTGEKTALLSRDVPDETNPPIINEMALGANHASVGLNVKATAHGKTYADIGSVWVDEKGVKFDLVRIYDEDNLLFLSFGEKDLKRTSFSRATKVNGNLTYVSDGVNTAPIVVESYGGGNNSQLYPGINNVSHTYEIVKDGVRIPIDIKAIGNTYSCDEFIITEEYDIVNPYNVAENLRANRPEGGYTENPLTGLGDSIFHYKQTLTVKPDGTIFTEADHQVMEDIGSVQLYIYQFYVKKDIFGGGVFRHLPGTKEFTDNKGRTFDMSLPLEYTPDKNHLNYDYPTGVTMNKNQWVDENIVPSRILDYYRDTDGNNVMGYMTGYLPLYDGEPSVRKQKTSSSIYMYDEAMKAYPHFVTSKGLSAENAALLTSKGSRIHGVSYRKYVDLREFENEKQYYTINHENMTYYYVDFLEAGEITVDLEKAGCVYDLTKFEGIGDISYERVGDKVVFTANEKGYIMLKAERRLEAESAFLDTHSSLIGARLVNYSDTDMTVSVGVASYDGNKLSGITIRKNVVIGANATENIEIDASSVGEGTNYKLFILDNDNVSPASRNISIDLK